MSVQKHFVIIPSGRINPSPAGDLKEHLEGTNTEKRLMVGEEIITGLIEEGAKVQPITSGSKLRPNSQQQQPDARLMKSYLTLRGRCRQVLPIIAEERAADSAENVIYSLHIIGKHLESDETAVVHMVSDALHLEDFVLIEQRLRRDHEIPESYFFYYHPTGEQLSWRVRLKRHLNHWLVRKIDPLGDWHPVLTHARRRLLRGMQ